MSGLILFAGIVGVIWFISWVAAISDAKASLASKNAELFASNGLLAGKVGEWESYSETLDKKEEAIQNQEHLFEQLFRERTKHYPVVAQVWGDIIELNDSSRENALRYKQRPARVAADVVKEVKTEKRELVKELVYWKYKSQNYEAVFPWLAEELEQDIQNEVESEIYYSVYTEKEREDPVTQFVSPEDFRKLSISDRNQLAVDRYWMRGKKTKWMIGKMYERYVGHLYEKDGWDVDYFGIHKRFDDLGRDIIARKGKEVHVVQCKNWSKFKTIYENHIFQLFGTSYSLQKENEGKTVTPVFYCSTSLSDTANEFANRLGIIVFQNHSFREYPCIKCNISPNGDRIYHLPFDQQYDTVKITPKTGEFYAQTVAEAERSGFRRAFKWSGIKG